MSAPMLSRFDLVFVLRDSADAERDHVLSEHIMDLHSNNDHTGTSAQTAQDKRDDARASQQRRFAKRRQQQQQQLNANGQQKSLEFRLLPDGSPTLPPILLRKYYLLF